MKQFELQGKLLLDKDTVVGIDSAYANASFPYWISNAGGATIRKVKVMLGRGIAGDDGGTITVSLYSVSTDDLTTNPVSTHSNRGLTSIQIKENWNNIGSLDYTFRDVDANYLTDYNITDIKINEPSFIIGTIDLVGDIQAEHIFLWVAYEDNE